MNMKARLNKLEVMQKKRVLPVSPFARYSNEERHYFVLAARMDNRRRYAEVWI